MFCSSIFTFSGNKPWCPRTLSFALNLHLLSHQFLTCMFVLLINPLLYIVIHSLGVRKSVFYHVITISTKKPQQFQSCGSHSSHSLGISSLPSPKSRMLLHMWDKVWHSKVWQINTSLGCSQYRCPSQGRMGRDPPFLFQVLRKVYSRSVLINGHKSSARAWDSPSSSFFQFSEAEAELLPIWFSVSHSQQHGAGKKRAQPNFQWTPQTSQLQGSKQHVPAWRLSFLLIYMEAASGHGCAAWTDGENGKACRRLCLLWRWHGWQSSLGIVFARHLI